MERSAEELFAMRQTAKWLLRLLDSGIEYCDSFFSCAGWTMGGIQILAREVLAGLKAPAARTKEAATARSSIKELQSASTYRHRIDDHLESLYCDNEMLQPQVRQLMRKLLEEKSASGGRQVNPLQKGLARLFGLDARAVEFCSLVFAIGQYECLESYFEDTLEIQRYCNRHLLGKILGVTPGEAYEIRSTLLGMGIVESEHKLMVRLTGRVEQALLNGSSRNFQSFFCRPLPKTTLDIDAFHIEKESRQHALALMGDKTSRPAHLLLYGAPGTGKTSFASAIAQTLGVKAWRVECLEGDNTQDRRASLTACLKIASRQQGSFVLVDEAERLLDTDSGDSREGSAKAWINELLERRNTRIIWITNKVNHLDPAVRRRFGFSIRFRSPGNAESLSMWNAVAARVGVEDRLPAAEREKFSQLYPVPVATMEMALRQAKAHAGRRNFCAWVERVLSAQVILQNDGLPVRNRMENGVAYDPEVVCTAMPVDKFLSRAARLAEKLDDQLESGLGAMLFYGPPGTGKTALGRHLAKTLERELIIRRASDLLGPYVGETEANIAAAFAEAEARKAILLIDEADSFLFGREGAAHSWEQTMVNEFLTQLENYRGICVCTTNFRQVLDSAAMRRFSLKMEFRYAGPEQIKRLYQRFLEPLAGIPLDPATEKLICSQKCLAPGDFKVVKQKMWLEEKPGQEQLVAALLEEQKLKLESESKIVGF